MVYADYECPYCARLLGACATLPVRHAFRHFPVALKHPRAWAAAAAAEAAGRQGAFWAMHDALFADQGRLEDPHLWARAASRARRRALRGRSPLRGGRASASGATSAPASARGRRHARDVPGRR